MRLDRQATSCAIDYRTISSSVSSITWKTFQPDEMGLIVFDELERTFCRRLLNQMEYYFLNTYKGRQRSSRIVPEPFFVHSDLTTAVQIRGYSCLLPQLGCALEPHGSADCDRRWNLSGKEPLISGYMGQRPDAIKSNTLATRVWNHLHRRPAPPGRATGKLGNKKGSDGSLRNAIKSLQYYVSTSERNCHIPAKVQKSIVD